MSLLRASHFGSIMLNIPVVIVGDGYGILIKIMKCPLPLFVRRAPTESDDVSEPLLNDTECIHVAFLIEQPADWLEMPYRWLLYNSSAFCSNICTDVANNCICKP